MANDKHTVLKKTLEKQGIEVVDLILEWNRFGHEDYWESARKVMETFDGIDVCLELISLCSILCIWH